MHILVLPSWYPTDEDPLKGSFFAEQAAALSRHGHRVSVTPLYADAPSGVFVKERREGALTEYAVHYARLPMHLTYVRIVGALCKLLRGELSGARPDIIHVHSFQYVKYARALRLLFGIPIVVTEHVTWFERGMLSEKKLRRITRDFTAADALIAVSPGLREQIRPYCGGKEIHVIPNLVNERFFSGGLRTETGDTDFGLVSVGFLDHKKGFDLLLRAFAAALVQIPAIRLTICGDGGERTSLEALARELGIEKRVSFLGNVPREEVARVLRENKLFVLPSRTETFGVVYVEAMACGLPILMTKTNAWEMLVTPETGLAVEGENVPALTAALLDMIRYYDRYDKERIASLCRERFSEEAVVGRLTELYEGLIKK